MSPREAAQTDPAQRLLLLTTYEALEMAGYTPDGSPSTASDRIGTFFGQTLDDYREASASQNVEMYYVTGGIRAFGAGRLNYHFKWEGPSYCVDAACSSSALAIQMGVQSLRSYECDTAVAGGCNVVTAPEMYSGLSRGSFLSPTGSCKTFDNDADGYCRGDGVGSVVLKRLEDAVAEGDNIQAVIKSVSTNHSAHAVSITHPHAGAQQRLMRRVLQEGAIDAKDIDYVEMHGTGTQAGDATEFQSVTSVLGNRPKDNPLHVGAIKANIGHAEAAAGTNSLIKILMMMRKNAIPPHVGIKGRINEKFPPLDQVNVRIDRGVAPFTARPGGDGKRKVLLNNFNATGGNTCMIIEDAPAPRTGGKDPRSHHVVALSAKTAQSLKQNSARLADYLESNPQTQLQDLAYTTTARRMHHPVRKSYAVDNLEVLVKSLRKDVESSDTRPTGSCAPTVFLFTGQGAHYPGMGRELFATNTVFRDRILESDDICVRQGLPSFKRLVTEVSPDKSQPTPTESQLALVSIELALVALWESWGVKPGMVLGHSLGEYAALCAAGVLSINDTLYLVGKRALLMEEKCVANSHTMLSIQSDAESIQQILSAGGSTSCEIACRNGPTMTVVSGKSEDIVLLQSHLSTSSVKSTILEVPFAFHSQQMEPILDEMRDLSSTVSFLKPTIPVASSLLAEIISEAGIFTADYLTRQAREAVNFQGALNIAKIQGIGNEDTLWIEVGVHPMCHSMARSTLGITPTKALPTLRRDENCYSVISKSLVNAYNSGINVNWTEFHRDFKAALKLLDLPTYAFDLKNYWIQHQGDWSLTKGDASGQVSPLPVQQAFSTTCLQQIDDQSFSKDGASVVFSSDLAEPSLNAAVRGHIVNGIGLVPSSVYADIAFTAANYVASRLKRFEEVPAMDLSSMDVFHPLIVNSKDTNQRLRVYATNAAGDNGVDIKITSLDGKDVAEHARCTVTYGDGQSWKEEWQSNAYLVQSRMDQLIKTTDESNVDRIRKAMIYRQFQTVVDYSPEYHTIDELFMDCELNESVAYIKFQPPPENGNFLYSPYWLDTFAHLPGFVLNANVLTPTDTVFISNGWKSFRIAGPLVAGKSYRGYTRMQAINNKGLMAGDVYIFDGDEIVVVCKGIKFQRMKRSTLYNLLGSSHGGAPTAASVPSKAPESRAPLSTKKSTKPAPKESSPNFSKILDILATEIGIDVQDLSDDAKISDLGVDSLLTITILQKLRDETGLDLPSSLFIDHQTVAEVKRFFSDRIGAQQVDYDSDDSESSAQSSEYSSTAASSALSSPPDELDAAEILLSTLITEVGVDASEISPSTQFADIGVDSLLTITILDSLKSQIGVALPASFFQKHDTFSKAEKALQSTISPPKSHPSPDQPRSEIAKPIEPKPALRAKSVLLQGRPSSGRSALFLLPDGAGSLFSYISLPGLPSGVAVYGLDSPFLANPLDYTISFEAVASVYVDEIRSIQPKGPYMLGGWSLGGIHAFETARQLISQGETVNSLTMIDSPCPGTLPPLPSPTLELLEKAGVFDGLSSSSGPISERTRQHFLSCVRALEHYTATPINQGQGPLKVSVIWAQEGVLEGRDDEKAQHARDNLVDPALRDVYADMDKAKEWLTGKRVSFGPAGWDKLTGMEVECHSVGGNHFSIMFPPKVSHPIALCLSNSQDSQINQIAAVATALATSLNEKAGGR